MREIVLRVPTRAVEDILDRLLPIVPGGVREIPLGDEVELRMRGAVLPSLGEVALRARRWPHALSEHEVPDDWRERRLADYTPDVLGGALIVRPEWAPPAPDGLIDIALADDLAFGSGAHPTTRAVLLELLVAPVRGAFGDLGCGSGVVGILAAKLGWAPVIGVELIPTSAGSARANAGRNGVEMTVEVADLAQRRPPPVAGFAANMPAPVHVAVAGTAELASASWAVVSGFGAARAQEVVGAYAQAGLRATSTQELHGWMVIVLERC
jgi:ribosomal protein L11 methyltransferase